VAGRFGNVWFHKAHGDDLPPAWLIAEAIALAFENAEDNFETGL